MDDNRCQSSSYLWRDTLGRREHRARFWSAGNVLLLDLGANYTDISLCENPAGFLEFVSFVYVHLHYNKKKTWKKKWNDVTPGCEAELRLNIDNMFWGPYR